MPQEPFDPDIFHPGNPAVIELRESIKGKFTTFFRGYKSKAFVIIDHPVQDGRLIPLTEDEPCVVRFIHQGNIIGFRAQVINFVRRPTALIFLRFPESVESSALRKSQRYPVKLEAVVAGRRLRGALEGQARIHLLNLSLGGCMVESYEPYEKGSLVYLTILLPDQGQINDVELEVKRADKKGDKFILGCQFADMLDPGYEKLKDYVHILEAFQVRA
ncbi:MAG: flagellar brake protein [Pseudomonadota bacterium]